MLFLYIYRVICGFYSNLQQYILHIRRRYTATAPQINKIVFPIIHRVRSKRTPPAASSLSRFSPLFETITKLISSFHLATIPLRQSQIEHSSTKTIRCRSETFLWVLYFC